jgi:hypothetical protein
MVNFNRIVDEGIAAQINQEARRIPNPYLGILYWTNNYQLQRAGKENAEKTRLEMNKDPAQLEIIAAKLESFHTDAMTKEVLKDPKKVFSKTPTPYLLQVAENLIGNPEYQALRHAIQNKTGIGEAFLAMFPGHRRLRDAIAIAPEEDVVRGATNALERKRRIELITQGIIDPKTGQIDIARTAEYDTKQISLLPEEERTAYHTNLGFKYTETVH